MDAPKMSKIRLSGYILCAVFLLLGSARSVQAAEAPTDTIPPGTKINASNWRQYQQFMSDGMKALFTGDHFWTPVKDWEIEVGPLQSLAPPKSYREATEKYGSQTKLHRLDTGGYVPENYVAGAPFANPMSGDPALIGQRVQWDSFYKANAAFLVSPNCSITIDQYGNTTRTADVDAVTTQLTHNTDPPYPTALPNNNGYWLASYIEQVAPEQGKYTALLTMIPDDPTRVSELYEYVPSLRRSLRLSEAARCQPLFGSDFALEDAFNGPGLPGLPQLFDIKFLREQKLLCLLHQNPHAFDNCGTGVGLPTKYYYDGGKHHIGWPRPSSGQWEVRDAYVIEYTRLPQFAKGYCYGKRVVYVDKESGEVSAFDDYDPAGKLWKMFIFFNMAVPMPNQEGFLSSGAVSAGFVANFLDYHASEFIGTKPLVDHQGDAGGWTNTSRYASPDGLMKIGQ